MLFRVIICMFCSSAWAPFALLGHCKNEHPEIKQGPDAQIKLEQVIEEYQIVSEVPVPTFHGPPVEGLKEHNDGLICLADGCSYACRKSKVMAEHWTSCHQYIFIPKDLYWNLRNNLILLDNLFQFDLCIRALFDLWMFVFAMTKECKRCPC